MRFLVTILILFLTVACGTARAQSEKSSLQVQTRIVEPFVEQRDGKLTGFSVELWDAIAKEAKLPPYTFAVSATVADLLRRVDDRRADLGIAAVSITAERDARADFSQPIFNAGLQVLVRDQGGSNDAANGALSPEVLVKNLFSATVGKLFLFLMLFAVVVAHLIWLLERSRPDGLTETKRYFPGIFKATWWAAATLAAQADEMPKSYAGRIIAVMLMFTSAIFIAYFTAVVTAQITVQQLNGAIRGPEDLPGKRVATTAGSTAESYLKENRARVIAYDTVSKATDALLAGEVDAVVYDAPVLLYYAAHAGKDRAHVVGPVFKKQDYGIVFPQNSPLRKPINTALLKLKEDGTYDAIYTRWFGSQDGSDAAR